MPGMFAKMRNPVSFSAAELDNYLARGWFRMRQNIFTTNFLQFNNQFYSAIWLRVALEKYVPGKKEKTLNKLNASFKTEIKKLSITEQHEQLYLKYREFLSFDVSSSLNELLHGSELYNRFDTHQINIYDGEKLIAAGFFDIGKTSAAGISSIYHPAYKKYSLGKYLIYLKMDFCWQQHVQYFYPGYFVPGYKAFDYKTGISSDSLEFLDLASENWLPYQNFAAYINPLKCMWDKLAALKSHFEKNSIVSSLLFYRFFDANLDPGFYGNELFDFPVFLYCFPNMGSFDYHLVVYDVRDGQYHLLQCSSVIHLDYYSGTENIFSSGLLKVDAYLAASVYPADIIATLQSYL